MFVANNEEIREMDRLTIESGIGAVELMGRAAQACYRWFAERFDFTFDAVIFCGTGNNGGDGYALALKLLQSKYTVRMVEFEKQSPTASHYREMIVNEFGKDFFYDLNAFLKTEQSNSKTILVDCLLGSGLQGEPTAPFYACIQFINQSKHFVLSIDGPSGLNLDEQTQHDKIVRADFSLIFQLPRMGLFFQENEKYIGNWKVLAIGLLPLLNYSSSVVWVEKSWIKNIKIPRSKFTHKGQMGHAAIAAGSEGKIGAALLTSEACLKSGAGLVTLFSDEKAELPLNTRCPEIMFQATNSEQSIAPKTIPLFDAWAIGPGIAVDKTSEESLKNIIQQAQKLVIDADGLNLLSNNKTWLAFLKPYTILTPHIKEFERLCDKVSHSFEQMELAKNFAFKYQVVLVLKGAFTFVITPEKKIFINSSGNPGMATAGSGDVLTGIIVSLLAQNYKPVEAAVFGVYLHGLAGDEALKFGESEESLTATSIIRFLGDAFKAIDN